MDRARGVGDYHPQNVTLVSLGRVFRTQAVLEYALRAPFPICTGERVSKSIHITQGIEESELYE